MPKQVIENGSVTLNSVDLSTRVKKISIITGKRAPQNVTAMQDTWEDFLGVNIKGGKISLEFYQDLATGSVYETMKGILNSTASTGVPIVIRPTTGVRTTGNPDFQCSVLLDGDFAQIDGSVGDALMTNPSFRINGTLSFLTSSS